MTIYHNHHIIPRHMGGSDDPSNLVQVTVEQHAQLHKQLWEEFGHWQDELAWKGLSQMIDKQELISKVISNTHKGKKVSDETRKKMSDNSPWKNKKRDASTIEKMKENNRNKGLKLDDAIKNKISNSLKGSKNPMYGKTHTEEAKQKIRESAKNRIGKKKRSI